MAVGRLLHPSRRLPGVLAVTPGRWWPWRVELVDTGPCIHRPLRDAEWVSLVEVYSLVLYVDCPGEALVLLDVLIMFRSPPSRRIFLSSERRFSYDSPRRQATLSTTSGEVHCQGLAEGDGTILVGAVELLKLLRHRAFTGRSSLCRSRATAWITGGLGGRMVGCAGGADSPWL